jgi:hypothetical protein
MFAFMKPDNTLDVAGSSNIQFHSLPHGLYPHSEFLDAVSFPPNGQNSAIPMCSLDSAQNLPSISTNIDYILDTT